MKLPFDFVLVAILVLGMLAEAGIQRWLEARSARRRLQALNEKHARTWR